MPVLHVRFPKPGFFLNDARVEVWLDGERVYDGSFVSGFERSGEVRAGVHQLATRISFGPITRSKEYTLNIGEAPVYAATLAYSRFWGNFKGSVEVTAG